MSMRIINFEQSKEFDELTVLRSLVENADPAKPYNIGKIRLAIRVLDKLASSSVTLEEEEWRFVNERVLETTWVKASPLIVSFVDKVANAAHVEQCKAA
ncbi:hypothetical protein [Enterovirga aerilata]|uniref:Uncharacterized protein n=1 Tax=Enterovirga aerilata TaxID=2730920 RepID=A0A849IMA2_9HYPH|nr:hypothetical protein [Enterovirga sp. DB1703]NNM75073.1 hypothetical protein [Enterovirga sp. DB1703]